MDEGKIIFYSVLLVVVIIVSIVRYVGWRKERKAQEQMKIEDSTKA